MLGGGSWPGQQVAVRFRERPLEIDAIDLGGQGVQDGLSEFIEMSLAGQDGIQVRAVAARGSCGAEADRGDVPFISARRRQLT